MDSHKCLRYYWPSSDLCDWMAKVWLVLYRETSLVYMAVPHAGMGFCFFRFNHSEIVPLATASARVPFLFPLSHPFAEPLIKMRPTFRGASSLNIKCASCLEICVQSICPLCNKLLL